MNKNHSRTNRVVRAACTLGALLAGSTALAQTVGPDVVYSEITGTAKYGPVGGVYAYALSSNTCNIGNQNLGWGGTVNGSPTLAMNAYRLHNGMLMQVGQGFGKTACCAAAGSGCGFACNGAGGSVLGSGCLDVYSAGYNGGQSRLQARSLVNPFTGAMTNASGTTGDAIFKRLQIQQSDMSAANFPGALYFVEGVYVGVDEVHPANSMNNASYKRVTVNAAYDLAPVAGSLGQFKAGIQAWRDHGLGAGVPDPSVRINPVTVPSEGTFYVASKVTTLPGNQWRFEYAVYNLNSHRSGGSFSIPIPNGVAVSSVGFHDVDYHSGEPYDNTNWSVPSSPVGGFLTWASPQTYAQNQNSNALRWGTMYNFWFTANAAPGTGDGSLGLFRPGTPTSVTFSADVPSVPPCEADMIDDGLLLINDIFYFIDGWFKGNPLMDWNQNHALDVPDHFAYLGDWFRGCP